MAARHPEAVQDSCDAALVGLVLKDNTYHDIFEYCVEFRVEAWRPAAQTESEAAKLLLKPLPWWSFASALCYALSVVFISNAVWMGLWESLSVSRMSAFIDGEIWRIFTAQFQHADAKHLVNNLLPFVGIGWLLWGYFGFLAFPVVPIFLGAAANFFAILTYPLNTQLIGLSGTVFAMAGMWAALYIKNDFRYPVNKRILRACGFLLILFFPLSLEQNVADRVHLLGACLGFTAGYFGWGRLLPHRVSELKSSARKVRVL